MSCGFLWNRNGTLPGTARVKDALLEGLNPTQRSAATYGIDAGERQRPEWTMEKHLHPIRATGGEYGRFSGSHPNPKNDARTGKIDDITRRWR